MSQFYVGGEVVCVNASGMVGENMKKPQCGKTYTVLNVLVKGIGRGNLVVSGCHNIHMGSEVGFMPSRFRPLDSLTEQIERIEQEGAPVEQELEPQYA